MKVSEYVKYLKQMLELAEKEENDPCGHCPIETVEDYLNLSESYELCKICQEFVGLTCMEDPIDWPHGNYTSNPKCPCSRPEGDNPIDRAWYHIIEYEKTVNLNSKGD